MSWKNGYEPIAKGDVLVIDEAGMIGTRQLARVASKMNKVGAKLVLVGDPDQLQPIEAGTPFRRITTDHGAATLTEIHRQKAAWQKQASRDLADGELVKALEAYSKREAVARSDDLQSSLEALVETYAMDVAAHGASKARLAFAHKRKDVHALTVDQSYVFASRTMDRHLAYVAMTRHRDDMRLFVNERDRPVLAIENKPQKHTRRSQPREGPTMG